MYKRQREHRGDGHTVALQQREVDGASAHVPAAAERLTDRGWLDGDELSAEGLAMVSAIEADTDRLALGPWQALGDVGCDRLAELLVPIRRAVVTAGDWPDHNPIGVPDPT